MENYSLIINVDAVSVPGKIFSQDSSLEKKGKRKSAAMMRNQILLLRFMRRRRGWESRENKLFVLSGAMSVFAQMFR